MPVIQDATVVNQPYDTSGNGGRKLVRLDNGWLVAGVWDGGSYSSTNGIRFYKSEDGANWTYLCYGSFSYGQFALVSKGNVVYVLNFNGTGTSNSAQFYYFNVTTASGDVRGNAINIDTDQTSRGNVSLAINEQGTELHATWASKNSTFPNSFNIRYAKGTINADGSVTWGAVEQITKLNTSTSVGLQNPSVTLIDNVPYILADSNRLFVENGAGSQPRPSVLVLSKSPKLNTNDGLVDADWRFKNIYDEPSTYTQSNPSAIFIPQEIAVKNPMFAGATQGVIAVAWQGKDATDSDVDNIRFSYSLDGGVTWSAMDKRTSGNADNNMYPTLTASLSGEIFIVFHNGNSTGVRKIKHNGSWGSIQTVNSSQGAVTYPSTLYDLSVNFTEPIFIYKSATKVGFYGSWTVTKISVQSGNIGEKTDKNNLLSYSITTDGDMSEVIEKVNGVEVGRKTLDSGESTTVSLTQEQWDDVRFGKYGLRVIEDLNNTALWEQGSISNNFGAPYTPSTPASDNAIRVKNPITITDRKMHISMNKDFQISVFVYDQNDLQLQRPWAAYMGNGNTIEFPENARTYRIRITRLVSGPTSPIDSVDVNLKLQKYLPNTLTIEMGSNKWEYTFDKRLAEDADMLSIVKATKDTNEVFLPAVKGDLISALQGKGVVVNGMDWEGIEQGIDGIELGGKYATGTIMSQSGSRKAFTLHGGTTSNYDYVSFDMSKLDFVPDIIKVYRIDKSNVNASIWFIENHYDNGAYFANAIYAGNGIRIPYNDNPVDLPVPLASTSYTWEAYNKGGQ